ncbi:DUF455 domain protein [Hypoxylon sp. NC1633]|nr:DUF455 domain protein [Hypoxylon sp. NC1633]
MQGFNMGRYVPPDVEGTTTGNKLHKKRPPGYSRRDGDGAPQQTVRFEMPFAVWCAHCPKPTLIGQGVRFNAAKRRLGSYHSTPVFAFRMRHADCGGAIEIRTDPANTTYVVSEGGRRRDLGDDSSPAAPSPTDPILTDAERAHQRGSAFARLERTIADRQVLEQARERVDELALDSRRLWEDPYERNRRLRAAFRVGRREREGEAAHAEDLRRRMGLGPGFELMPASDEDARRAALVDFGPGSVDAEAEMGRKALAKPLFDDAGADARSVGAAITTGGGSSKEAAVASDGKTAKGKRLKSEVAAASMRENLVAEIVGNTRVIQDPFLSLDRAGGGEGAKGPPRIPGIKRKRTDTEECGEHDVDGERGSIGSTVEKDTALALETTSSLTALVEYDSD